MDLKERNKDLFKMIEMTRDGQKRPASEGELKVIMRNTESVKRTAPHPKAYAEKPMPRPKKRKSKRRIRVVQNRNVALTVIMMYAVVGFFVGALMITRYSNIIRTDDELDTMEAKIEMLNEQAESLRLEVSLKDDIGMVQRSARERLGMDYPKNDQLIYVELDDEVKVELSNNETNIQ